MKNALLLLGVATASLPFKLAELRGELPADWTAAPVQAVEAVEAGATSLAWMAAGRRYVQLDYWPGLPPTPGGPMQLTASWPLTVAGQPATLHRTAFFRGRPDEVLVLFLTRGQQQYRLFARHETPARLQQLLATLRWTRP